MATEKQIKANRRNAQKSTGPKTAEGKAMVAQNAVKPCPERSRGNGLFAHENVIKCEKQADFDRFRKENLEEQSQLPDASSRDIEIQSTQLSEKMP